MGGVTKDPPRVEPLVPPDGDRGREVEELVVGRAGRGTSE